MESFKWNVEGTETYLNTLLSPGVEYVLIAPASAMDISFLEDVRVGL